MMEEMNEQSLEFTETIRGVQYDKSLHEAMSLNKQLNHKYCFNLDRHSSNFYLKIGATGKLMMFLWVKWNNVDFLQFSALDIWFTVF